MQNDDAATGEKLEKLGSANRELDEAQQERFDAWTAAMAEDDVPVFDDSSTWLDGYLEGAKTSTRKKESTDDYNKQMQKVIDESWNTETEVAKERAPQVEEILNKSWLDHDSNQPDEKEKEKEKEKDTADSEADEVDSGTLNQKEQGPPKHESVNTYGEDLGQASQMASYGFDTAAKIYGLEAVLKEIQKTDESDRDSQNPIGSIYDRLAPDPESRRQLFAEIHKDSVEPSKFAPEIEARAPAKRVGLDVRNHFYEKTETEASGWSWRKPEGNVTQDAVDAIGSTKKLLDLIETGEQFANLRALASEHGQSPIEYLLHTDTNPTLSMFFNRLGESLNQDTESAIQELAKQDEAIEVEKEAEEFLQDIKELAKEKDPTNLYEYIEDIELRIDQKTADEAMRILMMEHPDLDTQLHDKIQQNLSKLIRETPLE